MVSNILTFWWPSIGFKDLRWAAIHFVGRILKNCEYLNECLQTVSKCCQNRHIRSTAIWLDWKHERAVSAASPQHWAWSLSHTAVFWLLRYQRFIDCLWMSTCARTCSIRSRYCSGSRVSPSSIKRGSGSRSSTKDEGNAIEKELWMSKGKDCSIWILPLISLCTKRILSDSEVQLEDYAKDVVKTLLDIKN